VVLGTEIDISPLRPDGKTSNGYSFDKGEGVKEDIEVMENLSNVMMLSSLCGLGQAAPVPVLDTLNYFRKDYENRIEQSIFLRSLKGTQGL